MIKRVLILSSQPSFAELIRSALEEGGKFRVDVALSLPEIKQINPDIEYSLLILDMENPSELILDSISRLQKNQPKLQLIFLVTDSVESQIDAHNLVISRVIRKPFYLPHFLSEIERCLQDSPDEHKQNTQQQTSQSFSEIDTELLQKSLIELSALSQATHTIYFSNGIPIAKAGIYNDLIITEIQAFLASRAETPLHADLMKYKHFVGDLERSLIYFKVLPANDLLVMVFNASIALIEAKKQVNTIIEGLQEEYKLSMKNEFHVAEEYDSIAQAGISPQTGDGSGLQSDDLTDIESEEIASNPATFDTQTADQDDGSAEQKNSLNSNMEETIADAHIPSQWGQLDEKSLKSSGEIFKGWINEEQEEGGELNSSIVESAASGLMDIDDQQVGSPSSPTFSLPEDNDYDGDKGSKVSLVDDLISEKNNISSEDLLEGLVFPWDEEYQLAIQTVNGDIPDRETHIETVSEWQSEVDMQLLESTENSSLPLDEGIQPDENFSKTDSIEEPLEDNTIVERESDRMIVHFSDDDAIPFEMDVNAIEKEQPQPDEAGQPLPAELEVDDSLEKTQPHKAIISKMPEPMDIKSLPAALVSLNYTIVMLPRFQDHYLVAEISRSLNRKMPQLCIAFGWRLERLTIRPQYLQCTLSAPATISAHKIIRMMRKETSHLVFALQPEYEAINPSQDFWAEGYILLSGYLAPTDEMLKGYIQQTRVNQGYHQTRS